MLHTLQKQNNNKRSKANATNISSPQAIQQDIAFSEQKSKAFVNSQMNGKTRQNKRNRTNKKRTTQQKRDKKQIWGKNNAVFHPTQPPIQQKEIQETATLQNNFTPKTESLNDFGFSSNAAASSFGSAAVHTATLGKSIQYKFSKNNTFSQNINSPSSKSFQPIQKKEEEEKWENLSKEEQEAIHEKATEEGKAAAEKEINPEEKKMKAVEQQKQPNEKKGKNPKTQKKEEPKEKEEEEKKEGEEEEEGKKGGEGTLEPPPEDGKNKGEGKENNEKTEGAEGDKKEKVEAPKEGGKGMITYLTTLPASHLATDFTSIGPKFEKSFHFDRNAQTKATPAIEGSLDGSVVPPATKDADPTAAIMEKLNPIPGPKKMKTNPKAPSFVITAATDPQSVTNMSEKEQGNLKSKETSELQAIAQQPGEELLQPKSFSKANKTILAPSKTKTKKYKVHPELVDYAHLEVPQSLKEDIDMQVKPQIDGKLDGPKNQMEAALQNRDMQYEQKIQEAQTEVKNQSEQATQEQQKLLEKSRTDIKKKKEEGIEQAKNVVKDATGKISEARQKQVEKINAKIEEGETKASGKVDEADSKVVNINKEKDKKIAAEESKAAKKKAAEQTKYDKAKKKKSGKTIQQHKKGKVVQGFFGKIFNAIKNAIKKAFNAFKNAVKAIASALKKAVTAAISAAKNAVTSAINWGAKMAKSAINFATKAVKGLVEAGSKLLKGIVNVAFAAFPGIRDKINGAIDNIASTVNQAVDSLSNKLKSGIDTVANKLKKGVDFVANFCENAVLLVIEVAEAGLTGDFSSMPKIIFIRACNSLGLPGEKFWETLLRAKDQVWNIVKNPGTFFSNFAAAGKKGFNQFLGNIKHYILQGLVDWLFGEVAPGTPPPTGFSPGEIFTFVRNVLGVGNDDIEARAEELLGGGGGDSSSDDSEGGETAQMKVIQKTDDGTGGGGGMIKGFMTFFSDLISKGPAAIWEVFKSHIGDIKQIIIDKILDFLIQTVIEKATIKILALLIPGAGFLQAIKMAYDAIMFFVDNINDIMDLVNTVLDSLDNIMKGNIEPAANFIEQVLADTIPVIFRFLAKLLGLGGVPDKVGSIINAISGPLSTAVDAIILGFKLTGNKLPSFLVGGGNSDSSGDSDSDNMDDDGDDGGDNEDYDDEGDSGDDGGDSETGTTDDSSEGDDAGDDDNYSEESEEEGIQAKFPNGRSPRMLQRKKKQRRSFKYRPQSGKRKSKTTQRKSKKVQKYNTSKTTNTDHIRSNLYQ